MGQLRKLHRQNRDIYHSPHLRKFPKDIKSILEPMVKKAKEQGYLTYEYMNEIIPEDETTIEAIDAILDEIDTKNIELVSKKEIREFKQKDKYASASDEQKEIREFKQKDKNASTSDEQFALTIINGRIRLVSFLRDGTYRFLDKYYKLHNILYILSSETKAFEKAIKEFEEMVNDCQSTEKDFHDFFERHQEFILNDEYKRAHSKIVLETEKNKKLIPDYVLEPWDQNSISDILELKLPSAKVFVLKKSRYRFSSAVMEACAQLREYASFFEEERNRITIQKKYKLLIYKPKMFVILGRRGNISPIQLRRIEGDVPGLTLKTYDDVIKRAKERIRKMRDGNW